MTIKTLFINIIPALLVTVVTAGLMAMGVRFIGHEEGGSKTTFSSLFPSANKMGEKNFRFIEIKNMIITLQGEAQKEHYLLLDLVLTTEGDENASKAGILIPKIKGITVDVLSAMDYTQVRNMPSIAFREMLMKHYQSTFQRLGITTPFSEVAISKMVFQ